MAKRLKNHTIDQYLKVLSQRQPTPGGGSAAALTGACATALLSMVANYSIGKTNSKMLDRRLKSHLQKSETIKKRFTELVDLDADAYMRVVRARKKSAAERRVAQRAAEKVPREVSKLCYKAVLLAPLLIEKGNQHLLADVEIAVEMLQAAYNAALLLQNQT